MEVHELNEGNEVIVYYKGRVDDMSVPDFETHTAHIKLDNGKSITITDADYFDLVKSEDCENDEPFFTNDSDVGNNVNHPSHYNKGKIEVIEIMEELPSEYSVKTAICLGNVIKYVFRAPFKNGVEDLRKAKWYLERAIKNYEEETEWQS